MPSQPRHDEPGCWHHVINRGARRHATYLESADNELFLNLLGAIRLRYGIETHAYSLMTNHHHVLVCSTDGRLSAGIRYMASVYAKRFNQRHGFDGPLNRARFWSKPIEDEPQMITTARYIHRNPFDVDPTIALAEHQWSSFGAYIGSCRGPAWLRQSEILAYFGDDRERYRNHVESTDPADKFAIDVLSKSADRPIRDDRAYMRPHLDQIRTAVAAALSTHRRIPVGLSAVEHQLSALLTIHLAIDHFLMAPDDCADQSGCSVATIWRRAHKARSLAATDTWVDGVRAQAVALL